MKKSIFNKICLLVGFITAIIINVNGQNLQISGGNNFSVSLCSDGKIYAWGNNGAGQLGRDASNVRYPEASSSSPRVVNVPGGVNIRLVDAGSGNTGIALACDGSVYTWGGNCGNGNIGNGSNGGSCMGGTDGINYFSTFQRVLGGEQGGTYISNITYINASTRTTFGVESVTGYVLGWGNNGDGDLALGTTGNVGNTYLPSYVLTASGARLSNIKRIEGSDFGAYALSNDGYVYSWGANSNQDLGRTPVGDAAYARRVKAWDYTKNDGSLVDLGGIDEITGGDTHGLAIDTNGTLWSWGGNWGAGQRGLGQTAGGPPAYATKVVAPQTTCYPDQWKNGPFVTNASKISAGQQHSIALLKDGRVITFGDNGSGQLGNGSTTDTGCPVYVKTNATTTLTGIVDISDGDLWSFALASNGAVYVWGENSNGELGMAGGDQTFATLNSAIPTQCTGSLLPCPIADLGGDITKCEGISTTLLAGANGDDYRYTWEWATTTAGPWTLIGSANQTYSGGAGAQLAVTIPRFYRVTITDVRAYVADKCGPCPTSRDIIRVTDRTPPLATSNAGVCSGNVCFDINATGAINNTLFNWFVNQTTTSKLNGSTPTEPFCAAASTLTLNGTNYEVWVEDARTFSSTVGPTTLPCPVGTSGGGAGKFQQQFILYRDATITSLNVYYKTYNANATPENAFVRVYSNDPNKNSSSSDGVDVLTGAVSASVPIPRISTSFQEFVLSGINLPLTGSTGGTKYWLEVVGLANGEFMDIDCAASYPYSDAIVGEDVIVMGGATQSAQIIQRATYKAFAYNWNFNYAGGYTCGRFKLTAPQGTTACVLPIELVYFKAENKGKTNHLSWQTSKEQNTAYFEVLKSYDGQNWKSVGKINAKGNSNGLINYEFKDQASIKTVYYKLSSVDFDGVSSSSNIETIKSEQSLEIKLVPNPNNGIFTIIQSNPILEGATIKVQDMLGRTVLESSVNSQEGGFNIDLSSAQKGIYLVTVNTEGEMITEKLVIE